MTSSIIFQNTFILGALGAAIFTDTIKIAVLLITTSFKKINKSQKGHK